MVRWVFTFSVLLGSAYCPIGGTLSVFSQSVSNRLQPDQLDFESQQCMRCHDGSSAKRIELRPVEAPIEFEMNGWLRTTNHSIGMSYAETYEANPTEYIAPENLNPNITLIDGRIGCLSCHLKKENLLAAAVTAIQMSTGCTFDRMATQRAFRGPGCTQCHVK